MVRYRPLRSKHRGRVAGLWTSGYEIWPQRRGRASLMYFDEKRFPGSRCFQIAEGTLAEMQGVLSRIRRGWRPGDLIPC